MHRLAGGFMCYKYVTDMANLTYLFTDLPYFFRKSTGRFYCVYVSRVFESVMHTHTHNVVLDL